MNGTNKVIDPASELREEYEEASLPEADSESVRELLEEGQAY